MQPIVRSLLVLHPNPELRETLRDAPGQLYTPVEVASWDSLRRALSRAPLTAVAVIDPWASPGVLADELRAILEEFPFSTVLAALRVSPGDGEVLARLLDWGVADFVVLGHEVTPPGLGRRLRLVRSNAAKRLLSHAVPRVLPARAQALLIRAAEVVSVGGGAPELAASLRVSVRTVPRWCERADLPPPRRLLAWLRLLVAAKLLEHPDRSLASIARSCGYATEGSLKSAVREILGTSPSQLRESRPFETAAAAFSAELAEIRDAATREGRSANTWLN